MDYELTGHVASSPFVGLSTQILFVPSQSLRYEPTILTKYNHSVSSLWKWVGESKLIRVVV